MSESENVQLLHLPSFSSLFVKKYIWHEIEQTLRRIPRKNLVGEFFSNLGWAVAGALYISQLDDDDDDGDDDGDDDDENDIRIIMTII